MEDEQGFDEENCLISLLLLEKSFLVLDIEDCD